MTTPAVNRSESYSRPSTYTTQWLHDGKVENQSSTVITSVYRVLNRVRPASSSVPLVKLGNGSFRSCKGWSHYGFDLAVHAGGNTLVVPGGYYETRFSYGGSSFWSLAAPGALSFSPNLSNKAEVQALNKLSNQDFNLGVFLAEGREAVQLVGDRLMQIAKTVTKYRYSRPKQWKRVVKWQTGGLACHLWHNIPRTWLEVQYGWNPLLQDIAGSLAHLRRLSRPPTFNVVGRATGYDEIVRPFFTGRADVQAAYTSFYREDAIVSLWYTVSVPWLATLNSLGLINPAVIVWEKVPYSFVIDWALPIGSWLNALTADVGYSFQSGSLSRIKKLERISETKVSTSGGVKLLGGPGVITGTHFRFERSCYNSSPVPGIYVKNPLSSGHAANALSLLATAFR